MDSRTVLDYALFQLTPTRTRCDLVIFAGKKSEKIASGLLEPFLCHLNKDLISKGGYSIMLKPTSADASPWFTKAILERFVRFVSTPEVLERVVTIEREINQIESSNEQVNGAPGPPVTDGDFRFSVAPFKSKSETNGDDDAGEENPKVHLQRVLESRKAMLKKEQAMAYARALVAGFEMDYIYDLVSFSDAFGALRLREACINFMELCNKKNNDKIWLDEVAALQASCLGTSGAVYTGENNDLYPTGLAKSSASDSGEGTENGVPAEFHLQQAERKAQSPTWQNNHPHYMQNPMFQRPRPYPGYIFPGMQVPPSHYPGNVPSWPVNFHDSRMYLDRDIKDSKGHKSSNKKKGKNVNRARRHSTKSEGEEIDQSSSGSDSSDEKEHEATLSPNERIYNKKHNRKSSRKVVIRNINYIASATNEESCSDSDSSSSDEDEYVHADSIKQQVEAAVGSLKKQHKSPSKKNKARDDSKKANNKSKNAFDVANAGTSNSEEESKGGNWDIFQNLLMKDSDSSNNLTGSKEIQFQEEYSIGKGNSDKKLNKPKHASDDFLLTERSTRNGVQGSDVNFEGEEIFHGAIKRSKDDDLLMPSREEGYFSQSARFGTESSIIKTSKEEDWIIGVKREISSQPGGSIDHSIFCGEQISSNPFQDGEYKREVISDDSFMFQSRTLDGPLRSQPKADVFMVPDIVEANKSVSSTHGKVEAGSFSEPEDFSMMLGQNSASELVMNSRAPDMDYGNDISLYETVGIESKTEPCISIDATPLQNDQSTNTKNGKEVGRKVSGKELKSKAPKGSLSRSKSDIPVRSKISTAGSTRSKSDKEEEKRKKMEELLIQRQKRIAERSAAKGIAQEIPKRHTIESKKSNEKTKLQAPTAVNKTSRKPVMKSSTIDRLATARTTNKQLSTESKVGQNRKPTSEANPAIAPSQLKKTRATRERQDNINASDKKTGSNHSRSTSNVLVKASKGATPVISDESSRAEGTQAERKDSNEDFGTDTVLHTVAFVDEKQLATLSTTDASEEKNTIQILPNKDIPLPLKDSSMPKDQQLNVDEDRVGVTPEIAVHLTVENNLKSALSNSNEKGAEKKKLSFSPEISVMNIISTPPSDSEASPELNHSRKKWNNGESSPKIPKGFRKLIFFGRRS